MPAAGAVRRDTRVGGRRGTRVAGRRGTRVGVLALQGDFAAHARILAELGAEVVEVRRPGILRELAGLVIPGGESTALLRLLDFDPAWWDELEAFHSAGKTLFGTCAGLILLASDVESPPQRSFGFLDATVERNAYGRQIDSFETTGEWSDGRPLEMVFIRAPRIRRLGEGVGVLARYRGAAVLVEQGSVMAGSFHPELTRDSAVHSRFLEMARGSLVGV